VAFAQVAHLDIDLHSPKTNVSSHLLVGSSSLVQYCFNKYQNLVFCVWLESRDFFSQKKTAGFTPDERANFSKVMDAGFVDVYRSARFSLFCRANLFSPAIESEINYVA